MPPDRRRVFILFASSSHAVMAEAAVIDKGFRARLVPVPREASSDCGVCLEVDASEVDDILSSLSSVNARIMEEASLYTPNPSPLGS